MDSVGVSGEGGRAGAGCSVVCVSGCRQDIVFLVLVCWCEMYIDVNHVVNETFNVC